VRDRHGGSIRAARAKPLTPALSPEYKGEGVRGSGILRAFTLLEMLLVLALGAVLATVAAVSLASSRRAASAKDIAGQVAHFDRLTRDSARRSGRPARLTFDLDRGDLRRTLDDAGDRSDPRAGMSTLHLVGDARIAKVVRARESATAGQVSVPCSPRGQTPSYAVLLVGPGAERQWLVVSGLTGRVSTATDEREVQDIFRTLAGEAQDSDAR
jgi:prepilin-type N-terminal cleavage/methylation domain-containing protein